jgi:uncharacterized iron-regulated membrane protein
MAWATEAETLALTGVTVSTSVLAQAQGVIELFSGMTEDNTTELAGANARMLRVAVAYQAAWMTSQIDVTSRTDVAQFEQDGARFTAGGADALILAPLARRALDRLSWLRRRSARSVRPGQRTFSNIDEYQGAWLRDETSDDWIPSAGGWRS